MKKRKVNPHALKDFLTASETAGSTTGVTVENFEAKLSYSLNFYQRNYDLKDSREFFAKAKPELKEKIHFLTDKAYNEFKTIGFVFHFLKENKLSEDFHKPTEEWIKKKIEELLDFKKEKRESSSNGAHNIQKAIKDQAYKYLPEIEDYVDSYAIDEVITDFNLIEYLKTNSLSAIHTRKLQTFFDIQVCEYRDIPIDKDLQEAYGHITEPRRLKIIAFYDELHNNFSLYCTTIASKNVRTVKKILPKKLVEKVQYLKNSTELGVQSCNPEKIIGATMVVLYNVKYRKLTILKGKNLTVKGTTILDFEPIWSITKTLKKPEVFLSMFKSFPDLEDVKREVDKLSTKPSVANGRVNKDTLIVCIYR